MGYIHVGIVVVVVAVFLSYMLNEQECSKQLENLELRLQEKETRQETLLEQHIARIEQQETRLQQQETLLEQHIAQKEQQETRLQEQETLLKQQTARLGQQDDRIRAQDAEIATLKQPKTGGRSAKRERGDGRR